MLYRTMYIHNGVPALTGIDNEEVIQEEKNFSTEIQSFSECYGEKCMAYDKQTNTCRMLENSRK